MKNKIQMRFFHKISFRISLIILVIIFSGIGMTLYMYVQAQNLAILKSRVESVREQMEILHISVKNSMLAGEAPIAVELFRDFGRSSFVSDVKLYRANQTPAFSDNATIDVVNQLLGNPVFQGRQSAPRAVKLEDENLARAIEMVTDIESTDISSDNRTITIYSPLINQPKCSSCHGLDHVVRGVIRVSSSLEKTYVMTERNTIISATAGAAVILLLSIIISYFLNRAVISRIVKIGSVAQLVGEGNFKEKLSVTSKDEIGRLSEQFNSMVDGLNERFKLSKFVSKSTLDHVRDTAEIAMGGERKSVTVLFSDIRGFTAYSEKRDPEAVMKVLNEVMRLQSSVIHTHGGDIDKYVGDEIMAVFEGENSDLRACQTALDIREKMIEYQQQGKVDVAVGIGINSGVVVSGNMGSDERIDRTIIGDAVNLGARLCSVAAKNTIVISSSVYGAVSQLVRVKEHDPIQVKGKSELIKIYTLRSLL